MNMEAGDGELMDDLADDIPVMKKRKFDPIEVQEAEKVSFKAGGAILLGKGDNL